MGLRGAVVVLVGLVVGLVAVVAVVAGRDPVMRGVAVPVPPLGAVVAVEAPGRTPAFVASTEEGVRAFLGFAPHSGLPLAWCPSSGVFIEPVGASWFDIAGDYLFGPSPGGSGRWRWRSSTVGRSCRTRSACLRGGWAFQPGRRG